mmetsp:Transcript_8916/g.16073  ORF Transcript_8916/g.16073 Transcript_8916/m.16073 type:complete len:690 (-) Transcript_8916:331-2400(-)
MQNRKRKIVEGREVVFNVEGDQVEESGDGDKSVRFTDKNLERDRSVIDKAKKKKKKRRHRKMMEGKNQSENGSKSEFKNLNEALDSEPVNTINKRMGSSNDGNNDELEFKDPLTGKVLTEEEIARMAEVQSQHRLKLDSIMDRMDWNLESNPKLLQDALLTLIAEFRGDTPNGNLIKTQNQKTLQDRNDVDRLDQLKDAEYIADFDENESFDFTEKSKYIPMRLNASERKLLRLAQAALDVSEYTDKVDIVMYGGSGSKRARQHAQIREMCAVLSGLRVANDYSSGVKLIENREFADHQEFFQQVFEVARRHKVANPEHMRSDYGKLMHLLQDAASHQVAELLGFQIVTPLRTVYSVLKQLELEDMLSDPLMSIATKSITPHGLSRAQIASQIRSKEQAIAQLVRNYSNEYKRENKSRDEVHAVKDILEQCIYSIGDNQSFLSACSVPCERMLHLLEEHFGEGQKGGYGQLAIIKGRDGARLTHDHRRQFQYVKQSLLLWKEFTLHMFKLWYLSEFDFLDGSNPYSLRNTGQGLQRVQSSRHVEHEVHLILRRLQSKMGSDWIGSSFVHLGDHNVPNALVFIDKYAQVSRILNPILHVVDTIPKLCKSDPKVKDYVESSFGSVEDAVHSLLRDFFRAAFDGSGANDFFSAGSCIDGRLTSAWNWCSRLEKKPYYSLFLLSGFSGFDGAF